MFKPHIFSSEILKSCDIRGIVGQELHNTDAYFIGRSFGTSLARLGKRNCAVGYDGRLSSPEFSEQVVRGLLDTGIDVINLGLVPTPVVYFSVFYLNINSGLIITASHNPSEYNGFKFLTSEGPFHDSDIQNLALICENANYISGQGTLRRQYIIPEYINYLRSFLKLPFRNDLTIVWDPGNGAIGVVLDLFLEKIPANNIVICGEVDGHFPHHHPDPSLEENVEMLCNKVKETGADLGIAFDGDGDRIAIVDSEGYIFQGDQLLTIFARDFLKQNPGETIMSEVKASKFFYDDVVENGGIPLMWKVGHTNQKEKMKQENIGLAGETSGHIFFRENSAYDDALFAAVKLLNILGSSRKSITEMRKEFPVYHDSGEIRVILGTEERRRVMTEITGRLQKAGRDFIGIDGIRISCGDGFWMIRGSNTQPHLTIRCEAASKPGLEHCLKDMWIQLALSGIKSKTV